jgi:type IV pilus assembly protein PilA
VPAVGNTAPGYYSMEEWAQNPIWNALNYQMEQGHYFHYDFTAANSNTGYGTCQFTIQAFGNLDNDAIYSTFERSGAADQHGVNAAGGLFIDLVVE